MGIKDSLALGGVKIRLKSMNVVAEGFPRL